MKERGKIARKVYEQYRNGDSISNTDLLQAVDHFKQTEELLGHLGPVFHLAWLEAMKVSFTLTDFKRARGL